MLEVISEQLLKVLLRFLVYVGMKIKFEGEWSPWGQGPQIHNFFFLHASALSSSSSCHKFI